MEEVYGGPTLEDSLKDVTLFDLLETVKKILAEMPEESSYEIVSLDVTIEEQMGVIESFFGEKDHFTFMDLAKNLKQRILVMLTFLAMLELMRSQKIRVEQEENFGEIIIRKMSNG